MTDEELILKVSNLYCDICNASLRGKQRGMRIRDIRKKYGLEKRDLKVLLRFLKNSEKALGDEVVRYMLYKIPEKQQEEDNKQILDFSEVEDSEETWNEDNFDDECFIRIEYTMSVLTEKIAEDNVDITNVALLGKLTEDESFRKMWNQISRVSMDSAYIIDKGNTHERNQAFEENKRIWINSIIKWNSVSILECGKRKTRTVLPFGLYYDQVIEHYKCVFGEEHCGFCKEVLLDDIDEIEICEESLSDFADKELVERKRQFDIYDYIKSTQTEIMELKVYREGHVIDKLNELLKENQCELKEYDDYVLFSFKTDDAEEYLKKMNGYGRSVIVLKPERLREHVMDSIENTLKKYDMLDLQISQKK
ncbi:MAG: WYL domain-containing protein [Clostridiales bacterium]|nr:WYL domain-containing protein [Clostridiales bacterium]